MQNKIITLLAAAFLAVGCLRPGAPFADNLHTLAVKVVYPEGHAAREGAAITVENVASGASYQLVAGSGGITSTALPGGIYRISVSDRDDKYVFNGTVDKLVLSGQDAQVDIALIVSRAGSLVIKELYCGGCSKMPEEGTYQSDQYVIIHNNDDRTAYLDGLCLGTLSPYNSNAANPWLDKDGNLPEFLPIIQAVWQVGGTGKSFPLAPGADAVICLRGAINHAAQYPLSVNLNKPGYFVCYNPVYFPNPVYHPVPGDQIQEDHYLEVVIKMGQANAYTLSVNSPCLVLFRPEGITMKEFVALPENLVQVPGSSIDRVVTLPPEWVLDGVEVFNGGSSANQKRLTPEVDAGYVVLSEVFKGRTLMRRTDEDASALRGFEVLQDTNNSTADFYERETQSLHE